MLERQQLMSVVPSPFTLKNFFGVKSFPLKRILGIILAIQKEDNLLLHVSLEPVESAGNCPAGNHSVF